MNLTWHIVLKDFRRLKLGLVLWTLIIVGQIYLSERMFSFVAFDPGWFERQQITLFLAIFGGNVFAFFLAAAIVLEDSLVGTRMFWVTRPITGGRLLAAKSLGIFLTVLLWPLVIALPWWIQCGFGSDQLFQAARFLLLNYAIIALLAMSLAALAGEGSRFLLWTLTLLIALPLLLLILARQSDAFVATDVATSRGVVTATLIALAALAVIGIQFRSRRVGRALIVVTCAASLAILISAAWPWNVVQFWPKDTLQSAGTEGIKIELQSASLARPSLSHPHLSLQFQAKDLPPDFDFRPRGRIEAVFVWPDGTTFRNAGTIRSWYRDVSIRSLLHLPEPQQDPETVRHLEEVRHLDERAATGEKWTRDSGVPRRIRPDGVFFGTVQIPSAWAERFIAEPPACTVHLRIETQRAEVVLDLPWRDGSGRTSDGVRVKMVRADHTKQGAAKGAKAKTESFLLISRPMSTNDFRYFFVNRADGIEALTSVGGPTTPVPTAAMPVKYDSHTVAVLPPRVWRTDQWVVLPRWEEWLESGSLLLVAFKKNGGFERKITTDHLVVKQ